MAFIDLDDLINSAIAFKYGKLLWANSDGGEWWVFDSGDEDDEMSCL